MLDKVGPTFAFTLWVCARLLLVHSSTIARTLSPEIDFFVETLRNMGSAWKVAESYSSILQRILAEYKEHEGAGAEGEAAVVAGSASTTGLHMQEEQPPTVNMLADMRRCAFDLDFMISRQGVGGMGMGGYFGAETAPGAAVGMGDTEGTSTATNAFMRNDQSSAAAAAAAAAAARAAVDTEPSVQVATARVSAQEQPPVPDQSRSQRQQGQLPGQLPPSSSTASSGLLPLPTAAPYRSGGIGGSGGLQDFEYLDVFGFFNYPRLPQSQWAMPSVNGLQQQQQQQQPQPEQAQTQAQSWMTQQPQPQPQPQSFEQANYNITNYLVPTPESDWLFPAGA